MHIVGTRWLAGRPCLIDHLGATLRPEGAFHWDVGARTCVGYVDDGWHPCPDRAPMAHDAQCLACFRGRGIPERALDMPGCIFEPRCKGVPEQCVCSFGGRRVPVPHAVYIAFYGGLPKVGMTQERRIRRRLMEQGADAWFVAQRCQDRQEARRTELQIAALHGIPEYRSQREVFPQWMRPVDWPRIEAAARQWMAELASRFDVGPELHRLDHGPPLPARPHRAAAVGEHAGTWVGARGPSWFYRTKAEAGRLAVGGAPVLAVRRADLLGRWIEDLAA